MDVLDVSPGSTVTFTFLFREQGLADGDWAKLFVKNTTAEVQNITISEIDTFRDQSAYGGTFTVGSTEGDLYTLIIGKTTDDEHAEVIRARVTQTSNDLRHIRAYTANKAVKVPNGLDRLSGAYIVYDRDNSTEHETGTYTQNQMVPD